MYLSDELVARVDETAAKDKRSRSAIIRRAVESFLPEHSPPLLAAQEQAMENAFDRDGRG
jgi:predicted transcriptional regulator